MGDTNALIGVGIMAMRWHHARLRRLVAERQLKESKAAHPLGLESSAARDSLAEARRLESRYKRRLSKCCEKASDKKQSDVIDI